MTDLDMTKACAEAIAYKIDSVVGDCCYHYNANGSTYKYDPLHDDAQAMALVKKFNLMVNWNSPTEVWCMPMDQAKYGHLADSPNCTDLNRAIVECVAKLKEHR